MSGVTLPPIAGSSGAPQGGAQPQAGGGRHEGSKHKVSKHGGNPTNLATVALMALEKKKKALELIANTNAINVLKDKATYRTEREMNLTHFRELMYIFQKVSKDGKKAMNMEEFKAAFGMVLGKGLSEEQMAQLFMKIDANTDNTVDWDEFSTFMLLRAERQSMMLEEANTTLFDLPPPMIPVPHHQTPHRESIISVIYLQNQKKYVTCSREGTVCYWSEKIKLQRCFPFVASYGQNTRLNTLDSLKVKNTSGPMDVKDLHIQNGRWVHDFVYLSNCNKFAVSTDDHEITYYDFTTMEPQLSLDLQDSIALSMDFWCDPDNPDSDEGMLLYGTDQGYVVTFNFLNGALFSRNKVKSSVVRINMEAYIRNGSVKNFGTVTKRKAHGDWVTRVKYYHDFHSIVSCSPDPQDSLVVATQDGKNKWNYFTAPVHRGVNVFAYCKFPVCLVTGGTDRQLRLWNPYRLHHPMAALKGHNAPIVDVTINDLNGQILSLSSDRVIKVWDIRKQQCLQSIGDSAILKLDETLATIHFNPHLNGKLLAAATCLIEYNLKGKGSSVTFASSKSHDHPLKAACFNVNFRQIVTACDGGVVNVWDAMTGQKTFRFSDAHGKAEITALTFDSGYRRLLTGGRDGTIIMWNFNNGQSLRELIKGDNSEVTGLAYIDLKDHQYIVATSCNRKVSVFLDDNNATQICSSFSYPVDPDVTHGWHKDDIISMAFCKPNYLVTGGYDGEIILTNFQSGHIIHRMKWPGAEDQENPNRSIDKVLFLSHRMDHPLACALLSSGSDGFIRWWNIWNGELYWEMDGTNGRGEGIFAMCANESNKLLAIADAAGNVKVFDITETCIDDREMISPPELISSFKAHTKCVVSVEFMDGDFLLTGSTDGTARIFTYNGEFVGTLGQENLWDLVNPETYAHPLRPPDVELLLARERMYTKKFREVTHKLVLGLRDGPKEDTINENESLPRITSGISSFLSRSSANLTPGYSDGFTSSSFTRSSSVYSSGSAGSTGSLTMDDWKNRQITTAEALVHGYGTWYGRTRFARELHLKQPPKRTPTSLKSPNSSHHMPPTYPGPPSTSSVHLPKLFDNPSRTYHHLKPHDLNELVDIRTVPVLSALSQRGPRAVGMLLDSHFMEAAAASRSRHPTRGFEGGKTKGVGVLAKTNSLEAILNRALGDDMLGGGSRG
ncbi:hypothetical protein HDU97_007427 [Phlyctochytrium planicorne]|nr:hypothetical protein HDU97_007427 [Phlyctochytrium planicorne]